MVCSMFRHLASCFRDPPPVQCTVGVSPTKALLWGLGSALRWVRSYQGLAMGLRQCVAAGVCPTKALQWGLGSALQWGIACVWGGVISEPPWPAPTQMHPCPCFTSCTPGPPSR